MSNIRKKGCKRSSEIPDLLNRVDNLINSDFMAPFVDFVNFHPAVGEGVARRMPNILQLVVSRLLILLLEKMWFAKIKYLH